MPTNAQTSLQTRDAFAQSAALWNTMAQLLERCAHDEQERHLSDASRLCGLIAEHEVTAMRLLANL